jgi:capsular exopolysaccharide synthesis family protein
MTRIPPRSIGPSAQPDAPAPSPAATSSLAAATAAAAPDQFQEPPEQHAAADWSRARHAIVRFRWLVVAVVAAALGAGYGISRVVDPAFVAETIIWIDQDARRGADATGGMRPNQSFDAAAWVDLVRSYQVLDTVVRTGRLNIEVDPDADPVLAGTLTAASNVRPGDYRLLVDAGAGRWTLFEAGAVVDNGALGEPIGRALGFQWTIAPATATRDAVVRFSAYAPRDAARRLAESLSVHISPEGNFMRIALEGPEPQRLADILNAIGARYVAVAADLRQQKLTETTRILATRTADAAQALRHAENAFESFRVRAITLPADASSNPAAERGGVGEPNPAVSSYFALQRTRAAVARERAALERVANAPGSDQAIAQLDGLDAVARDAELSGALKELAAKRADLRTLVYRYSDVYPPVQRLQSEIAALKEQTIPALARRAATTLAATDDEIARDVGGARADLRAMPARAVEENRLRRAVELASGLYTTLQQRYDAARVAEESTVADVRILDPAVAPDRPYRNSQLRIMLLALGGGLGLALFGAVAVDRVDPKVRYPQQVSTEMGLVVLGALPHLRARRRWFGSTREDDAAMIEAIRAIRLNVAFAHGAGPVLVTVTSPGSADGKSFLAMNLARAFAQNGRRTMLVDGDLRRGALHRKFGVGRRPGFSDYLLGDAESHRVVRATGIDRLDFIPSGTRTQAAPDLLGRASAVDLIASLRARYDVIICDSPPLTAGIDPYVLGVATGSMLVVLRPGVSHREMASAKLDALARMPVRLLGAVLNDVRDDTVFASYSYYLPGYEATDERAGHPEESQVLA